LRTDASLLRPIACISVIAVAAICAPLFVQVDPNQIDLSQRLSAPGISAWFGTDELGRDLFSRTVHGLALSLGLSLLVTVTATSLGIAIGAMAGWFYKTLIDKAFNWVTSTLSAIPFLLVMAAALSLVNPSLTHAYMVLAGLLWVGPARLCRAEVIRTKPLGFVVAARALGVSNWRILLRHVLPGCIQAPLIHAMTYLPEVIALEAALSFLGLGAQPPQASLGRMVFDGLNHLGSNWWLSVFPVLSLAFVVALIRSATWAVTENVSLHLHKGE
jgi:peptide/nickel transport system permease protein